MTVGFHPAARAELEGAVEYYESGRQGLGLDFAEEVYATIGRILAYPYSGSTMSESTRRCLVNRFPYGIIYQVTKDTVRIIAVAHLHRRPGYWKERNEQSP